MGMTDFHDLGAKSIKFGGLQFGRRQTLVPRGRLAHLRHDAPEHRGKKSADQLVVVHDQNLGQ